MTGLQWRAVEYHQASSATPRTDVSPEGFPSMPGKTPTAASCPAKFSCRPQPNRPTSMPPSAWHWHLPKQSITGYKKLLFHSESVFLTCNFERIKQKIKFQKEIINGEQSSKCTQDTATPSFSITPRHNVWGNKASGLFKNSSMV